MERNNREGYLMPEEKKKPKFKAGYRVEFSMGALDFERHHEMLRALDRVAIFVRAKDISYIVSYYTILKELYINMKPLMYETVKKEFKEQFKEVEEMMKEEEDVLLGKVVVDWLQDDTDDFPLDLARKLEEIHMELLEVRQIIGYGVPATREETTAAKFKRGFGLK